MLTKPSARPISKKAPSRLVAKKPTAKKVATKKPLSKKAPLKQAEVLIPVNPFTGERRMAVARVARKTKVERGSFIQLMSTDTPGRVQLVHKGLPVTIIDQAADALDVAKTTLFDALSLPVSTMTRRARSGSPLSLDESDRMDRVAQVFKESIEVFGDKDMARDWMSTRLPALENRTPLELLDSSAGYQLVLDTLGQIAYGAPA